MFNHFLLSSSLGFSYKPFHLFSTFSFLFVKCVVSLDVIYIIFVFMPMITLDTSIIGINLKSRRTKLADSLVILHNTGRVTRADLAFTGVSALEVDAGLVARTSPVLETDGHTGCAAGGAETHRLVVQHLARLAGATQPRPVAGIDTAARLAALVTRALCVTPTLHLAVRAGEDALLVHQEAVLALADGLVEVDLALLVGVAGESCAGIITLLVLSVAG